MQEKTKVKRSTVFIALAFLLGVPAAAHLLFSWMGYNPTDDGFTLAYSRRILEGQVPHRDFIIIRPFLSPLIHTPFVLFAGEYMFWISRLFVWFQFACISWAWVAIINRAFDNPFGDVSRFFFALVAFVASVNLFALMAWHTVDGVFFASLGAWLLATRRHPAARGGGYVLIAIAYLCKQSFVFLAPLSLLIMGEWREKKHWAALAAPGLLYGVYLLLTGALDEAISQVGSQTGLFSVGVLSYLNYGVALGAVAGFAALWSTNRRASRPRLDVVLRVVGSTGLILVPAGFIAVGLYTGNISTVSYGVFGMLAGATLYHAYATWKAGLDNPGEMDKLRVALLILVLAWCASLSLGANSPLLGMGPMFVTLVALVYSARYRLDFRVLWGVVAVAGLLVLIGFGLSRPVYIYNEDPYTNLTEPLGGVLPGGSMIYTNPTTHAFMSDLDRTVEQISRTDKKYAIIPDAPGYWPQADQSNPLSIDWQFPVELSNHDLVDRVVDDLEAERGETVVIVQKVDVFSLSDELLPLDKRDYPVVRHVRENFDKTGETKFFELYE
ncbi:hypothetical protein BH24ACT22_BH24ACT22_04680 [soil metagenome]